MNGRFVVVVFFALALSFFAYGRTLPPLPAPYPPVPPFQFYTEEYIYYQNIQPVRAAAYQLSEAFAMTAVLALLATSRAAPAGKSTRALAKGGLAVSCALALVAVVSGLPVVSSSLFSALSHTPVRSFGLFMFLLFSLAALSLLLTRSRESLWLSVPALLLLLVSGFIFGTVYALLSGFMLPACAVLVWLSTGRR